jgi:glutaredoxin 3
MINENTAIEIYSSRNCSYCHAAKTLLNSRGLNYTEIDVTFDADKRREMMDRAKQRTVPQIFIDGKSIGGFRELAQVLR